MKAVVVDVGWVNGLAAIRSGFVDAIAKIGGPARSHRCTTRHEHAYRDLRGVFR